MKPIRKDTSWSSVASWYDTLLEQSPDSYQSKIILPNLLRMVSPQKGMSVADIACGQGFFSRALHEKGARVIGCDISQELIDKAREHSSKEIHFFTASADHFSSLIPRQLGKDKSLFDAAIIVLAIQNIERMSEVFAECSKILKPNGKLFLVTNHPTFRIPQHSSWEWDEKNHAQFRRVDAYMSDASSTIDMTPGQKNPALKKYTVTFHRPLQSYVKALHKSGLAITRLEEWISHKKSATGPRAAAEDRIRKEIPMFMCIEATKLSQPEYIPK